MKLGRERLVIKMSQIAKGYSKKFSLSQTSFSCNILNVNNFLTKVLTIPVGEKYFSTGFYNLMIEILQESDKGEKKIPLKILFPSPHTKKVKVMKF